MSLLHYLGNGQYTPTLIPPFVITTTFMFSAPLRLHHNTGVILVQASWLSNSIDTELINVANFSAFRADRPNSKKVRSGRVVTYAHYQWCSSTKIVFSFNAHNIQSLTVKCKSHCLSKFKHIIITNVYIPPNTSHYHVTSFYDTLITSTSHLLSNNLYIVAGDFNSASTHSFSFGL